MHPYTRSRAVATLFLLALIWGGSFILMKKALIVFNPLQIGALRMTVAALVLLPFSLPLLKGIPRSAYLSVALVGILGSGIPAMLFPFAQRGINSAVAGVLNGLTPAFTLIVGVLFFRFKATWLKAVGLALGFVGAAILATNGKDGLTMTASLGYASLVVLATIFYGISSNIQRKLAGLNSLAVCALALVAAAIPHLVWQGIDEALYGSLSHAFAQPGALKAFGWIFILAFGSSAISFVIYNDLVQKTDAVFASTSTYITPIFALMWGLFDGEVITPMQYAGMAIILVGVYLVNRRAKQAAVQADISLQPVPEAAPERL